jgi:hypothetical protein
LRGQKVVLPARKAKLDLLITSARYHPDNGTLMLAKGFEPVGQVWSDILLLGRVELLARLEEGQRIFNGDKEGLVADFEPGEEIHLVEANGKRLLVAGDGSGEGDDLGVPLF